MLTMGLNVVGRPSNSGGATQLAELLEYIPHSRSIIVMGENDQKPTGQWPGKEGAISIAKQLSDRLQREIHWALPPDHAKDIRDWRSKVQALPTKRQQVLFQEGLCLRVIHQPPHLRLRKPSQGVISLMDFRQQLTQQMRRIHHKQGLFLNSSPTGAGKSHADLEYLCWVSQQEQAS